MATKYIVNNVTGQTITGDLSITGTLNVSGEVKNNSTGKYRALLSQTGVWNGTNIGDYANGLIIGEQYTITNYVSGDDFTNVAEVISGNINETGCVFTASGGTPSNWFNGSELSSQGELVVDVLENSLGFDIYWIFNPMGAPGFYLAYNNTTGPLPNSFPRQKTFIQTQIGDVWGYGLPATQIFAGTGSMYSKDDVVYVQTYDAFNDQTVNDALYYAPVEITINQDLDTTPVDVFGSTVGFPFSNVSYTVYCGENQLFTSYSQDGATVNDMTELITLLNNNSNTNQLGVFSAGGEGGIKLTMAKNFENQLCPDNQISFNVFND